MTIGIVLALGNPVYHTQAEDLQFFRIGTGGIAGTYYPIGLSPASREEAADLRVSW
jgi:TRAP-type uncharacterized transport system substrate-binding protein